MFILLSTLFIGASRVLSQNIPIYPNNLQIANPDQIYFADQPRSQLSVLPIARTINETERANYGKPNVQDSYLLEYLANRNIGLAPREPAFNPINPNIGSNMPQPSINLQPPVVDRESDNYALNRFGNTDDSFEVKAPPPAIKIGPLSRSVTNFGLNLIKRIQEPGRNLVLSPFSIATLLALLQQGSMGMTQQQITMALQMPPDVASVSYKNVTENVRKRGGRNILNMATNIYIADAFQINPAFKSVAINNFNSEITPSKFARPDRAAQMINNWVAAKTNDKITKLVSADSIGENTQVVLVNAIYFKGPWDVRFNPDATHTGPFTLSNGSKQMVSYMRMRKFFRTGVDRSNLAQIIVLPFERQEYTLMVILPAQATSVANVLPTLTDAKLLDYHQFPYEETELELPKFTVRADTDLNLALRQLGILNIFGSDSELSGLGTYRSFSPQVSSAVHSAMLSVDENGGSAAAATAFSVVALSYDEPTVIFKATRPFIAVLWDSASGVPLFIATIESPTA